MKTRIWTIAGALAVVVALVAVPSALAAYASPKLEVRYTGSTGVVIKLTQAEADDPTAAAVILAPEGTQVTANQAPGALLGHVEALVIATGVGNAQLPISGQLLVAAPGQVAQAVIDACLEGSVPTATWIMALSAAGQSINLPVFLAVEDGVAGIFVCLPHPTQATFGAKVVSAELTVNGVFSQTAGVWVSAWAPYDAAGALNANGIVVSPAGVLPGTVTATARRRGLGANLTGRVTQAGPVANVAVTIFSGQRANRLRRIGRVRTNRAGSFTFRARTGTFFRASVNVAAGPAPVICQAIAEAIAPIPCVNPTINGFAVQSRVARKR